MEVCTERARSKKANEEGVEASVITERYIAEFEKDFNDLGLTKHDHNPRVTEYMPQIIKFVEDLVERKKAYVVEGQTLKVYMKYMTISA